MDLERAAMRLTEFVQRVSYSGINNFQCTLVCYNGRFECEGVYQTSLENDALRLGLYGLGWEIQTRLIETATGRTEQIVTCRRSIS